MDKNKKKTIGTAAAGLAAGVGGSEAARLAKEWITKPEETESEQHDSTPSTNNTTTTTNTTEPVNPQNQDNYAGITEIQPVDTGGTEETADVIVDIPTDNTIAEVDNVNPDEIAETIITPIEDIIDDGLDVASTHQYSDDQNEDINENSDLDDDEDLAEVDENDEEEGDDGEMIDDII